MELPIIHQYLCLLIEVISLAIERELGCVFSKLAKLHENAWLNKDLKDLHLSRKPVRFLCLHACLIYSRSEQ